MSRSKWKCPNIFLKCLSKNFDKNKIWNRSSIIPSYLIGSFVFIHSGTVFKKIFINREKVGFKFGEFVMTRSYTCYGQKSKKLRKRK
jgi:ribosomal protein S19